MQKKPVVESLEALKNQMLSDFAKSSIGKLVLDTIAEFRKMVADLHKLGDIVKANFELGQKHYNKGNFKDAVMRFRFVTWLEPKHASGWYWLGISQQAVGDVTSSIKSLQKCLQINPDLLPAREALSLASVGKRPTE